MTTFKGFPTGKDQLVMIPQTFFSDLLPLIDDLAELKVILFSFWALPQRDSDYPYLTWRDFVHNAALMAGLRADRPDEDAEDTLRDALARAVARGALLQEAAKQFDGEPFLLYFANTERGRLGAEQVRLGAWRPGTADTPIDILPPRPTIFKLYEDNIGALTPMMADELKDAAQEFPADWIEDAIRQAVRANKRSWNYVRAILNRWKKDGKDNELRGRTEETGQANVKGKYDDFIES